jgi:hypothetical protein
MTLETVLCKIRFKEVCAMSASEIITTILVSLCLTVFLYMLVPVILIIRGKQYPASKIKKIAIINGAIVWLICTLIASANGNTSGSGAVFLWTWVGYKLLMKKLATDAPVKSKPAKSKQERFYRAIIGISIFVTVVCILIIWSNW